MPEPELPELDTEGLTFDYPLIGGPFDGSSVRCPPGIPFPKQIWLEWEMTFQHSDGRLGNADKYHVYKPSKTTEYPAFEYVSSSVDVSDSRG